MSLSGQTQPADSCNCILNEQYRKKAIGIIRKYEQLSEKALINSEDKKYKRAKYHKKCGGPYAYYFREKLKDMTALLKPVLKIEKVFFIYEDELPEENITRYRLEIKLPDQKTCTITWLQPEE